MIQKSLAGETSNCNLFGEMDRSSFQCIRILHVCNGLKPRGAPTEIHRGESCQSRHGICSLQLSPVSQEDVEDVVLRSGAQGALVHAATHQLTVVDHHNLECVERKWHHQAQEWVIKSPDICGHLHCRHSHESLWHRSSPLPQYCLPLVLRFALTGHSLLGFRIMLKICLPVHRAMGWRTQNVAKCQWQVTTESPDRRRVVRYLNYSRVGERDPDFFIFAHEDWRHYLAGFWSVKEGVLQGQEVRSWKEETITEQHSLRLNTAELLPHQVENCTISEALSLNDLVCVKWVAICS